MNLIPPENVIISEEELKNRIEELGNQISTDYEGKHPVLVSVLKGAFYFMSDLSRQINIPINIDFMSIGIYSGVTSQTGIVKITKGLDISITGRHVLLVEDIIGTGLTLGYLVQYLESLKPASLKICTLLDDPKARLINIPVEYTGFTAPDCYMVGYGLDYKEEFRHLPYIAKYKEAE